MIKKDLDIYKNPNIISIAGNISNKQHLLINRYFDMGFVMATADSSVVVHAPIIYRNDSRSQIERDNDYEQDRESFEQNFEKNIKLSKKLDKRIDALEKMFSKIREVYPSFGKDMESKIPSEDYNLYISQQMKFKKSLTVHAEYSDERKRISDKLLERKDKISEAIDSEDATKACRIEDTFLISELEKYFEILRTLPPEEQKSQNERIVPFENSKIGARELAMHVLQDRKQRVEKYDEILKLFSKLNNKKCVRLIGTNSEENYR